MAADDPGLMDVWADNLEDAFERIRQIVDDYPIVSMDTEFPGIVARPLGSYSKSEYNYQTLRCNVDMLKLIQLGMTFSNDRGEFPPNGPSTFQFHFRYDLKYDFRCDEMYSPDSIDLLKRAGIDFKRQGDYGIDFDDFGENMMSSGLILNPEVTWIAFHSGYDLGYLLKVLTNAPLPKRQAEFFEHINSFFPIIYDVKYMMKSCRNLKGGLQDLADDLEIKRVGPQHQAGSDSLLTMAVFFKMKRLYFEDNIDDEKYCGVLFGLGVSWVPSAQAPVSFTGAGSQGHYILAPGTVTSNGAVNHHDWTPTS